LQIHQDLHKAYVDKQRITKAERNQIKKETPAQANQRSLGQGKGNTSRYKAHPISTKAQFSGIDRQVAPLPSENAANTNEKLRDALENKLENRYNYRHQPTVAMKPRPY
jgi:hypothetical protein